MAPLTKNTENVCLVIDYYFRSEQASTGLSLALHSLLQVFFRITGCVIEREKNSPHSGILVVDQNRLHRCVPSAPSKARHVQTYGQCRSDFEQDPSHL